MAVRGAAGGSPRNRELREAVIVRRGFDIGGGSGMIGGVNAGVSRHLEDGWTPRIAGDAANPITWVCRSVVGKGLLLLALSSCPVVAQPAQSNVTVLPASPKVASAPSASGPSAKSVKRDDIRDLMDQVPPGLRKRFGF